MEAEVEEVPVIYTTTNAIHFVHLVIRSCFYVASMDLVQSLAVVRTGSHWMYVCLRERWMAYESQGGDRLMGTVQTRERVLLLAPAIHSS